MSYKEKDIAYETPNFRALNKGTKGFGVYKTGITHSTRYGIIGHTGEDGLARAIAQCDYQQAKENKNV